MRWAALLAAPGLLAGCQLANLIFPQQQLQLLNRSGVAVVVRVAPFQPGQPLISDAGAKAREALAPGQGTAFTLPTGHYGLYVEQQDDPTTSSADDVILKADGPGSRTVVEKFVDHPSTFTQVGSQQRVLGFSNP